MKTTKRYYNSNTDVTLNEKDYKDLLIREWTEQYNQLDEDEKVESGWETLEKYISYQKEYGCDTDFVELNQ